jgi:hypothetical protein
MCVAGPFVGIKAEWAKGAYRMQSDGCVCPTCSFLSHEEADLSLEREHN